MNPLWQVVVGPCAAFLGTVGIILLVTAVMGRPRGTRPSCRACRSPLRGRVTVPDACPSCSTSLTARNAVRFGGYRLRGRLLLVAVALVLVPAATIAMDARSRAAAAGMAVFGTVTIERRPSAARFAEMTVDNDGPAWAWIRAHLEADELADRLRRDAAALVVGAIHAGVVGEDIDRATDLLGSLIDEAAVGAALLELVPEPRVVVTDLNGRMIRVDIDWSDESALARSPQARIQRMYALVDLRIDGIVHRPMSPGTRSTTLPRNITTLVQLRTHDSDEPPQSATVELDFVAITDPRLRVLSGRPDRWPGVIAHRRVVIEVPVTAGP